MEAVIIFLGAHVGLSNGEKQRDQILEIIFVKTSDACGKKKIMIMEKHGGRLQHKQGREKIFREQSTLD